MALDINGYNATFRAFTNFAHPRALQEGGRRHVRRGGEHP